VKFKITKFVHSCLLVETTDRVALFDPGAMSANSVDVDKISSLDDIFITHIHQDHLDMDLLKKLVDKFPEVRITTTPEVVEKLVSENIKASIEPPEGVSFFDSPHENVEPLFPVPQEIGINYLDSLTDPGDSHSFNETKAILALPIQAPWGSTIKALNLALDLKPKFVLPIHDWHWREEAKTQMYNNFEKILGEEGITFYKLVDGEPVEIEV
jgi:L-ascorbate metabolism protein UlaG (beta-lactamase superfamily)